MVPFDPCPECNARQLQRDKEELVGGGCCAFVAWKSWIESEVRVHRRLIIKTSKAARGCGWEWESQETQPWPLLAVVFLFHTPPPPQALASHIESLDMKSCTSTPAVFPLSAYFVRAPWGSGRRPRRGM